MKEYTIQEIQRLMDAGALNAQTLAKMYLERIAQYDGALNSIADLSADALGDAARLDEERWKKGPRGPLHGIPVLLKDNIFTADGLRTTANAVVLKDYRAPYDATLVAKLREAGCVILGKTNCSEFAYFVSKYPVMPSGYGGLHGQVVHPYDHRIDPYGSSTGSAVAVAANFVAVSIGTETNGSLMSPAWKNSIVSVKPTMGMVSRHGIIPISLNQDTAGPMSRTVEDSAIVLDTIKGADAADSATHHHHHRDDAFVEACHETPKNLKVGLLTFENYPPVAEEKNILNETKSVLEAAGASCVDVKMHYGLISDYATLIHEFKRDVNACLGNPVNDFPVTSLLEIIRFNRAKPSLRIPYGQCTFHAAQAASGRLKEASYLKARAALDAEIERFLDIFDAQKLDAVVTTTVNGYAPIGGLPSIIVPAKALSDLTPRSVVFIGKKWSESTLFTLASHYEKTTKHRIPPKLGE